MNRFRSPLNFRAWLRPLAPLLACVSIFGPAEAAVDPASATIDKLVLDGLNKAGLKPNAPATDEVFLRRIYLDVIGRIPTADEARRFLDDTSPDKRTQLIDTLLKSEGYVSRWFSYWADVLRVKTNANDNGQEGAGAAYGAWIKQELFIFLIYE